MSKTRSEILEESRKKGTAAGVATAGTVALAVAGLTFPAAIVAVPAVLLGYRWWKHRANNGIKF